MALSAGVVYADLALGDTDRLTRGIAETAVRSAQQFTETFQRNLGGADFYNQADIGRQSADAGRSAATAYATAFQRGVSGIDYADDPAAGRQAAVAGGGAGRAFIVALEQVIKNAHIDYLDNPKAIGQGAVAGAESGKAFSAAFRKEANNGGGAAAFFNIGGAGLAAFANVMRDVGNEAKKGGDNAGWSFRQSFLGRSFVGLSTDASNWFSSTLLSNPYVLGTVAAVGATLGAAMTSAMVGAIGLGGIAVAIVGAVSLVKDYNKAKTDLVNATNAQADAAQRWLDAEDRWIASGGKDLQAAKDKKKADEDQTAAINAQADAKKRLANTPDGIPQLIQNAKNLGSTLKSTLQDLSKPFIKPFSDSLATITQAVKKSGADLKPGMQDLAGAVAPLTGGLTKLVTDLMPAFSRDLQAASTVLKHLGEVTLPQFEKPLAFFFDTLAKTGGSKEGIQALDFVFASLGTTIYAVSGILIGFQYWIKAIDIAWHGVAVGVAAVSAWFGGPFTNAMVTAFNAVVGTALSARNGLVTAWNDVVAWFIAGWTAINGYVVNPVRVFFTQWIPSWVSTGRNWIVGLWNDAVSWLIAGYAAVNAYVVQPVRIFFTQWIPSWISTGRAWLVNGWNDATNWIIAGWRAVENWVINPLRVFFTQWIPSWVTTGRAWIVNTWNDGWNQVTAKWQWIETNVFGRIRTIITVDVPNAFREGTAAVGRWWEDLKGIVAKPINFVIKTVLEDGILGAIRWIASKVGVNFDVHVTPIPGYASGGQIQGPGTGTSDSILGVNASGVPTARVSAGEYIVNADSTRKFLPILNALNAGQLPGFALGGLVGDIGGWFSDTAGAVAREVKGLGQTAIDIITDPVGKLTAEAGKLLAAVPGVGFAKDIPVGAAKTAIGWIGDWVKSNITSKFSQASADVLGIQNWLRTEVDPKPYVWGAVGPNAYDCSGLVGEVIARLFHLKSFSRYFVTGGSEDSFLRAHGFQSGFGGPNSLDIGMSATHTMGRLAGLNFEAQSSDTGIFVGSGTSDINKFPSKYHLDLSTAALGGAAPTGALGAWIATAIQLTGVPRSWASALATIIQRESGGNPNAVNNWDSNAAAGHPSSGLAQVIGPTFAAYHQPGTSGNIFDPVANIAAAINYIKARYGDISRVQQANPNASPHGYDNGGIIPPGFTSVFNGLGTPEALLTTQQWRDISTLAARGGEITVRVIVQDGEVKGLVRAEIDDHDQQIINQLFKGAGQ